MRKATRNYIIDAAQGLLLLAQAISGSVLWFILPGGHSGQGWGLSRGAYESTFIFARHTWLDIHKYLAVALLVSSLAGLGYRSMRVPIPDQKQAQDFADVLNLEGLLNAAVVALLADPDGYHSWESEVLRRLYTALPTG
jgi:hypothetical protein